jgi:glucosamine-phosphate N-acetyltransferase
MDSEERDGSLPIQHQRRPKQVEPAAPQAQTTPDARFRIRPLEEGDYGRGFMRTLSQLDETGDVSLDDFSRRLAAMRAAGQCTVLVAVDDDGSGEVAATGSLHVQQRFVHGCRSTAIIDDVVVDRRHRGGGLGRRLIEALIAKARELGCHDVTLQCREDVVRFYSTLGFGRAGAWMTIPTL